jgi:hypothetical protein
MGDRSTLHRLVDSVREEDVTTACRVLAGFTASADVVERALLLAPVDDEPDTDDADAGVTEARQELARGEGTSADELKRELGLG